MLKRIMLSNFRYPDNGLEKFLKIGYPWITDILFGISDVVSFFLGDLTLKLICMISIGLKIYQRITYKKMTDDYFSRIKYQAIFGIVVAIGFIMIGCILFFGPQHILPLDGIFILTLIVISIIFVLFMKLIAGCVRIYSSSLYSKAIKLFTFILYVILIILYPTAIILYISVRFNNSTTAYLLTSILCPFISLLALNLFIDRTLVYLNRDTLRDYINNKTKQV